MAAQASGLNDVRGNGSATGTAATVCIAAPLNGRIYVTDLTLTNSSATGVLVTLNDSAGTQLWAPATGSYTHTYATPLQFPLTTAMTFTAGGNTSTLYCNAQGYVIN